MSLLRRARDFPTCRLQSGARTSMALAMLGVLGVGGRGTGTSLNAGRAPRGQQSAVTIPGSPEGVAAFLEEAKRLQSEADRHIDAKQFEEALEKTGRALALRRQHLGDAHPDVAYSMSRLGLIAYSQGQYERAEAMFRDALRIREATLGANHEDVADSAEDLASVLQVRGDYVQPERLYLQALAIYQKMSTATSPPSAAVEGFVAGVRNNLGRLYYRRGEYDDAEAQYLEVVAIRERTRGEHDPGVATALANLGGVYYSSAKYAMAVQALQRALGIQEQLLPANHPSLATSSFNLAAVYFDQGDLRNAEARFQRALDIDEHNLAPQHPDIAIRLLGLADVLRLKGEYARAAPLYERALSIREQALGSAHPDVAAAMLAWSRLRLATGDFDGATDLMTRGAERLEDTLALVLTTGSEEQKRLYLRTLVDETDISVSLHFGSAPTSPAAASLALTNILQRKGRSIDARADQIGTLRRHLNAMDAEVLNRLLQTQSRLATIVISGVATEREGQSVTALRREIQQLEQTISARNSEFRAASAKGTIRDIQDALPGESALIEFFAYRPFQVRNVRSTAFGAPRYAAFVLRRDGIAGSVDLGEAGPIDQQVQRFRRALSIPIDQGAAVRRDGRTLHQATMVPLEGALRGVKQIIISPDGALNLIPFSALVGQNGKYLVEDFTISYVTSGRDLTRLRDLGPNRSAAVAPPAIVANPLFDGRIASRASSTQQDVTRGFDARVLEQTRRFAPLPGTAQEGAALAKALPDARLYTGAEATEALVKQLKGPSILHIATHGFFLATRSTPQAPLANPAGSAVRPGQTLEREDALVLSGLALAGANQRSSGEGEDGLLTAIEVAGLDLWGTRMVVLSACESGLGDVRNGEGVYGLRRALVLAGSESQVMSLWQVPDAATRSLMVAFYQRLQTRQGRADALRSVQLAMLHGKPSNAHPFFWAGFIQSGDWRPAFD